MIDYYTLFKPESKKQIGTLAKRVAELKRQIPKVQKRLSDEQNQGQRIERDIQILKGCAGEKLTEDRNAFDKFKNSLKKLTVQLETSQEVVSTLSKDIIPQLQRDLQTAATNLRIQLAAFVVESRPVADKRINELLIACIEQRQSFLDAFTKIYADCGVVFQVNDESFCPGIWAGDEISDLKLKLGMDENG